MQPLSLLSRILPAAVNSGILSTEPLQEQPMETETLETPAVLSLREQLDPGYQWDYSTEAALERLKVVAQVVRQIEAKTVYSASGSSIDGAAMHIGYLDFLRFFGNDAGLVEEHCEKRYHYKLYRGVLITAIED